jgi:DNA-binding transcriptional ArsR family regulator
VALSKTEIGRTDPKVPFLTDSMIELIARRFRLLGDPLRLRLLHLLQCREYTVNELAEAIHASQSNVSRHLGTLHEGGLLSRRRDGNNICYSVTDPVVAELCRIVCDRAMEEERMKLARLQPPAARKKSLAV